MTEQAILCESSADRGMMEVILSCTREITGNLNAPAALSLIASKDSNGSTPLHYLSYSRVCPYSSLVLMMDYCSPDSSQCAPDPTTSTDTDGDTPLHWAFDGYMSPRRIKQLTRYHKKALRMSNANGRRPLDQFVENFVDSDWYLHDLCGREIWENIQGYLKVLSDDYNDDSVDDRNNDNEMKKEQAWFPLHAIAGSPIDFPPFFLDIALHYGRDEINRTDGRGWLPLHAACDRRTGEPGMICSGIIAAKILAGNAQAAFQVTKDTGRLPIHIAIASKKPLLLIAALLKAYPSSLNIRDPVTGLHPFLLAGLCNNRDASVTYGLLRTDPSILQAMVKTNVPRLRRVNNSSNSLASYNSQLSEEAQEQASKMLRTRLVL